MTFPFRKQMKALRIFSFFFLVPMLLACSDDSDDKGNNNTNTTTALQDAISSTIDNVVIPSYKRLDESFDAYYNSVSGLTFESLTQGQIDDVSNLFLTARNNYEYTESFFFGADNHFEVDSEINQWPLDVVRCQMLLDSDDNLSSVNGWPSSIVGWHGIEYILFRNGKPRTVTDITPREWQYLQTLTANIRVRCKQLLCGWDASASQSDKDIVTNAGLHYTSPLGSDYRTYMTTSFTSVQAANAMLVGDHGMMGLSDEIALTKLGRPHNDNDAGYIESPYSHQSVNDMVYNVRSIRNMWKGSLDDTNSSTSFNNYFTKVDSNLASQVTEAISETETAIAAIQTPFTEHYMDASVETAIEKANTLSSLLEQVNSKITAN